MDVDERIGVFVFFIGIILLVTGLLFLSGLGSIVSACGFFFGITLVIFGMLIRLGFFYGKLFSLNGLNILLISFSVICFAFSFSLLQFVKVELHNVIPILFRGVIIDYRLDIQYQRMYISISSLLFKIGLGFLATGLIIRIYNIFRTN